MLIRHCILHVSVFSALVDSAAGRGTISQCYKCMLSASGGPMQGFFNTGTIFFS